MMKKKRVVRATRIQSGCMATISLPACHCSRRFSFRREPNLANEEIPN